MSDRIDLLLTESELDHDTVLRGLLGDLEREATAVRPIPSAELAALMTPHSAGARRARRRSFAARSALITGIAVIGALGLGATAAAASPEARSAIGAGFAVIAHLFGPADASPPAPTPRHSGPVGSDEPSSGSTAEPSSDPTSGTDDNPGSSGHSGDGKSGDTHGNGKGNQSGNGSGKGQGNGGPAPTH